MVIHWGKAVCVSGKADHNASHSQDAQQSATHMRPAWLGDIMPVRTLSCYHCL
jgi:hypothetical protein